MGRRGLRAVAARAPRPGLAGRGARRPERTGRLGIAQRETVTRHAAGHPDQERRGHSRLRPAVRPVLRGRRRRRAPPRRRSGATPARTSTGAAPPSCASARTSKATRSDPRPSPPPSPIDLRRFLEEEQLAPGNDFHGEHERLRLSVFGSQLMLSRSQDALEQAMKRMTHQLRVRRVALHVRRARSRRRAVGAADRPDGHRVHRAARRAPRPGRRPRPGAGAGGQLRRDHGRAAPAARAADRASGAPEGGGSGRAQDRCRHPATVAGTAPAKPSAMEGAIKLLGRQLHGARDPQAPDR